MPETVQLLTKVTGVMFVIMSTASAGMTVAPSRIAAEAHRARPAIMALLANFVAAPLIAWMLVQLIPMRPAHAAGLLLLGLCAGAPFIPKLVELSSANTAFGLWLMLLLCILTIPIVPLAMPVLLPGANITANVVVPPLLATVLLPLALGVLLRRLWPPAARLAAPALRAVSNLSLATFAALVVSNNLRALWSVVGSGAILASILFTLLVGAAAYILSGPDAGRRRVIVLSTAQRNVAVALVAAESAFANQPDVRVMVVVLTLVSLPMVLLAARVFRAHGHGRNQGTIGASLAPASPTHQRPSAQRSKPRDPPSRDRTPAHTRSAHERHCHA